METHFSKAQLKDKDNKSSEKILRKCVHCGFCNATCPTYQLLGDELDGPRGRIYLIKDMLDKWHYRIRNEHTFSKFFHSIYYLYLLIALLKNEFPFIFLYTFCLD